MTYNYKLTGKHTLPGMTDQDMNFILRKESAQNWAEATWVPKNNENTDISNEGIKVNNEKNNC